MKTHKRRDGRAQLRGPQQVIHPRSAQEIQAIVRDRHQFPTPIRPVGANSSITGCTAAEGGTLVDMTQMKAIVSVGENSVTVQAGIRLHELSDALADQGLEFSASYDFANRTVGGAICAGCLGPSMAGEGGSFASQVIGLKMVTPQGRLMTVDEQRGHLLAMLRLSYGLMGVVYEVTLRVRPIYPFVAHYHKLTIEQFAALAPKLRASNFGVKYFLMPFRDRVYVETRNYNASSSVGNKLPWRLKDWIQSSALPTLARSVGRVVPINMVRYTLIDGFNEAAQALVNRVSAGCKSTEQTGRFRKLDDWSSFKYCTWSFPAAEFDRVVNAYDAFCKTYYREHGFRCDMPTVGCRVQHDTRALLSPSFDQPAFTLSALCTRDDEWENFLIDWADFAIEYGGIPLFNQTKGFSPSRIATVFGARLQFLQKVRQQLDPHDVLINPFFAQYLPE